MNAKQKESKTAKPNPTKLVSTAVSTPIPVYNGHSNSARIYVQCPSFIHCN